MARHFCAVAVLVLCMAGTGLTISPFFTSTFYNLQNTIERFTYCRAYPTNGSSVNATVHLIQSINSFLDLANYSSDSLENFKEFIGQISMRDQYAVDERISGYLPALDTNARCDLVEDIFDIVYPTMHLAAYNRSATLNLTNLFIASPLFNMIKVALSEQVASLWLNTSFPYQEMDFIGHQLVKHASELQANLLSSAADSDTKRVYAEESCCSSIDKFNYYMDLLFATITRARLSLFNGAIESRMAVANCFSFIKNKLSSGFGRKISPPVEHLVVPVNVVTETPLDVTTERFITILPNGVVPTV